MLIKAIYLSQFNVSHYTIKSGQQLFIKITFRDKINASSSMWIVKKLIALQDRIVSPTLVPVKEKQVGIFQVLFPQVDKGADSDTVDDAMVA